MGRHRNTGRSYAVLILGTIAPLLLIALISLAFRVYKLGEPRESAVPTPVKEKPVKQSTVPAAVEAVAQVVPPPPPPPLEETHETAPRRMVVTSEPRVRAQAPPRLRITAINGQEVPHVNEAEELEQIDFRDGPELTLPDVIELAPAPEVMAEEPVADEALPAPRALPAEAKKPLTPVELAALLGLARTEVKEGNLQTALRTYEQYLQQAPNDLTVRQEYAGVLVQAGEVERALKEFRQLLTLNPKSVDLRLTVADVATLRKDYKLAIQSLQDALKLSPNSLEVATRLARVYTFAGRYREAYEVYESRLGELRPGDVNVPRRFGALLIDLQLYPEALSFLKELHRMHPTDMNILADLARVWARLQDRSEAIKLTEELAGQPASTAVLLEMADALYLGGDYEVALFAYGQLLNRQPESMRALIGLARTNLELFNDQETLQLLSSFKPDLASRHDYQLAWAELHQTDGQYVEALMIYKELLSIDENDAVARLALGKLYATMNDQEKAKAQFAMIKPDAGQFREARLRFAQALFEQRRFQDSIDVCNAMLCEDPGNGQAQALLGRNLVKVGKSAEAEAGDRAFLYRFGRIFPIAIPVQLGLGRVLHENGKYAEAAQLFECVLKQPAGHLLDAAYGLARAQERMGNKQKAQEIILSWTAGTGRDTRNRLLMADLFYGDNDDGHTAELLNTVLGGCRHSLPALIRLADVQARSAQFSGDPSMTLHTTDTILQLSATNTRGLLARARAFAVGQDWGNSVATYDHLIDLDPNYLVPRLEKARVLYSARQYDSAQMAYLAIQCPSADEKLLVELGEYARREPRALPILEPYLHIGVGGPALHKELRRVATMCSVAIVGDGIEHILLDNEALAAEQFGAHLEAEAKCLKGWRNYQAIPIYQDLIAVQPANTEALFDLGGVFGNLKQTNNAIQMFQATLEAQPLHRDASVSLNRAVLEIQPRANIGADYFNQRGRGGLAQIQRLQYGGNFYWPTGDENEWYVLGYHRALLVPTDDAELDGNVLTFGCQKKCDPQTIYYGVFNIEQYENRVKTKPTYDVGIRRDFDDCITGWASTFLYNVLENGESLRQNIYRAGLNLGGLYRPTRYWEITGNYQFSYYSDVNSRQELFASSGYNVTLPPTQLRVVASIDYFTYAQQTQFATADPAIIFGAVHPYFAPSGFTYYETRLEWTHWLSRDYFVYSNQAYYSLQYALGFDNTLAAYNTFRGVLYYDVKPWLTLGADGGTLMSPNYDTQFANAYTIFRWPFFR